MICSWDVLSLHWSFLASGINLYPPIFTQHPLSLPFVSLFIVSLLWFFTRPPWLIPPIPGGWVNALCICFSSLFQGRLNFFFPRRRLLPSSLSSSIVPVKLTPFPHDPPHEGLSNFPFFRFHQRALWETWATTPPLVETLNPRPLLPCPTLIHFWSPKGFSPLPQLAFLHPCEDAVLGLSPTGVSDILGLPPVLSA